MSSNRKLTEIQPSAFKASHHHKQAAAEYGPKMYKYNNYPW